MTFSARRVNFYSLNRQQSGKAFLSCKARPLSAVVGAYRTAQAGEFDRRWLAGGKVNLMPLAVDNRPSWRYSMSSAMDASHYGMAVQTGFSKLSKM